jgi:hypothetical protein
MCEGDYACAMRIFGRLRRRASRVRPVGDQHSESAADQLAIAHYDRLGEKAVISQLTHLSRDELAEVEVYERAHRERPAVLEALNYARQGGVDAATAKAVGDFERSVAGRRSEPAAPDRHELDALRQEARYQRERLDLYRAKLYSGKALSDNKLRELQRGAEGAAARLKRAEDAGDQH